MKMIVFVHRPPLFFKQAKIVVQSVKKIPAMNGALKEKNLSKKRFLIGIIFQHPEEIVAVEDVFSQFITSSVKGARSRYIR